MNKKERELFLKLYRRMNTTRAKKTNEFKEAKEKKDFTEATLLKASVNAIQMCMKGLTETLDETGNPISELISEFKQ